MIVSILPELRGIEVDEGARRRPRMPGGRGPCARAISLEAERMCRKRHIGTWHNSSLTDQQLLARITFDPGVMTGKPVIKASMARRRAS